MAAKLHTSRGRRGADDDPELEGLQGPPAPQMQSDGLAMPVAPSPISQAQTPQTENLARHDIRDKVAMGGMSALDLQSLVRGNVFLSDEDISAWTGGATRQMSAPAHLEPPPVDVFSGRGGPNPHAAPIGGADALGFEGAKAPQGMMAPQGLLTAVGLIGMVKGLMGVRSDMPQPGAMTPKGDASAAPKASSSPSSSFQSVPRQASTASSPAATPQTSAPQVSFPQTPGPSQAASRAPESPLANVSATPAQAPSFAAGSTGSEPSQAFQPVAQEGQGWLSNAMWGRSRSPFIEIVNRFFALLKALLGSDRPPPHLRGGGGR